MIWVESPHRPGTIAIARGELARFTDFEDSLDQVQVPRGTKIKRLKGASVSKNRNSLVSDHMEGDWICFIDDDQVIPDDTVLKLLSHEVAIVGALYSTKMPPFAPTAHKERRRDGIYVPWTWTELAKQPRLVPCAATGTGAMLIRRQVFESVGFPWFVAMDHTDDVFFCQKATKKGWQVYMDREAPIGHTTTVNVWPALAAPGIRLQMNWLQVQLRDDAYVPVPPTTGAQEGTQ